MADTSADFTCAARAACTCAARMLLTLVTALALVQLRSTDGSADKLDTLVMPALASLLGTIGADRLRSCACSRKAAARGQAAGEENRIEPGKWFSEV